MTDVYEWRNYPGGELHHFVETPIVGVTVPPGSWVVHARALIGNVDGDDQGVTIKLRRRSTQRAFDEINGYLFAGGQQMFVPMQGTISLEMSDTLELCAATYDGLFAFSSIIAIAVDRIVVEPPA